MKILNKEDLDYEFLFNRLSEKTSIDDYQTLESFERSIRDGNYVVFKSEHCIFPCEFLCYPTGLTVLRVHVVKFTDGDFGVGHLREGLSEIEGYCKEAGIDRTILEGRPGWARLFKDYTSEDIKLIKNIKGN